MSFLKNLFSKKANPTAQPAPVSREEIQATTNKMWEMFVDILDYYNSISCQCAFPRFRQYVAMDCVDYRGSFYMSETEGLVYHAGKYFDIGPAIPGPEANNAIYTCRKCGSTFNFGWADFSIHVNRSFLKVNELKVQDIGAAAKQPIPFVVGLFGHKYPERSLFDKISLDEFTAYLRELK